MRSNLTRNIFGLNDVAVEVALDYVFNEKVSEVLPVESLGVVILNDLSEHVDYSTDQEYLVSLFMLYYGQKARNEINQTHSFVREGCECIFQL